MFCCFPGSRGACWCALMRALQTTLVQCFASELVVLRTTVMARRYALVSPAKRRCRERERELCSGTFVEKIVLGSSEICERMVCGSMLRKGGREGGGEDIGKVTYLGNGIFSAQVCCDRSYIGKLSKRFTRAHLQRAQTSPGLWSVYFFLSCDCRCVYL